MGHPAARRPRQLNRGDSAASPGQAADQPTNRRPECALPRKLRRHCESHGVSMVVDTEPNAPTESCDTEHAERRIDLPQPVVIAHGIRA